MTVMTPITEFPVLIDGQDHLSTEQVARYLQIKPATVYAYVSRGVLRRIRVAGRRESYFPLAEVEALVRPSQPNRRRAPGLTDDIRTAITLVEPTRLSYRGQDAGRLAREAGFTDVAALLWQHPGEFVADPADVDLARAVITQLPTADLATKIRMIIAVVASRDAWRDDRDPARVAAAAARLIMTSAQVLNPAEKTTRRRTPSSLAECLAIAGGLEPDPRTRRWVEQSLVLLADHDLAGSTTAVRVAASARANPYAAIGAGVNAWDSPLHGTASRSAYRLITELLEPPGHALSEVVESAALPAGFGHLVYTDVDPRAELLIETLHTLSEHPALAIGERLADLVWRRRGAPRNVDLALALAAHALGGRAELGELIFVHARMAGWVAHALEEYACPPLRFRLHGVYTGPRP